MTTWRRDCPETLSSTLYHINKSTNQVRTVGDAVEVLVDLQCPHLLPHPAARLHAQHQAAAVEGWEDKERRETRGETDASGHV